MKSADEFQPTQFDDWTLRKNRQVHQERLNKPRALTDTSSPRRYQHVQQAKGGQRKKDAWRTIDYENRLLLQKMTRIATHGSGSIGGPPPKPPKVPNPGARARLGGNHYVRKQQQERIARENMALLKRINDADPLYSTNKMALAERDRVYRLSQMGRFRNRSRFVDSIRSATSRQGTTQDRRTHSTTYEGVNPSRKVLAEITVADMENIIKLKKPPGSVRTVFAALMILVSPFETTEADLEWDAVTEWVGHLGGVKNWLSNLWNFNLSLVPVTNAQKTEEFLAQHQCDPKGLKSFSVAVLKLLEWIESICSTVKPLTQRDPPADTQTNAAPVIQAKKVRKKPTGMKAKAGEQAGAEAEAEVEAESEVEADVEADAAPPETQGLSIEDEDAAYDDDDFED